jgi:hypothetical protein
VSAIVVIVIHTALAVHVNDPVGLLLCRKHRVKIFVATDAVGITVVGRIVRNGGIDQVIGFVVKINVIDTGHGVDHIQSTLEGSPVILQHRAVQRPLNDVANVVAILADDRFHVLLIDRSENDTKGQKKEK